MLTRRLGIIVCVCVCTEMSGPAAHGVEGISSQGLGPLLFFCKWKNLFSAWFKSALLWNTVLCKSIYAHSIFILLSSWRPSTDLIINAVLVNKTPPSHKKNNNGFPHEDQPIVPTKSELSAIPMLVRPFGFHTFHGWHLTIQIPQIPGWRAITSLWKTKFLSKRVCLNVL